MLAEIVIRNFAIIEGVSLQLAPGLNTLTGETGAGKSIIVDALSAVLGERTSPEVVRAGESGALIEAFFELDQAIGERLQPLLDREGLTGEYPGYLILSREIRAEGRSVARVNGRATAAATVRQVGELLVDIHGQTEHLSLLRVPEHINFLDRYAHLMPLRSATSALAGELHEVRAEMRSIREDSRSRLRRLERLQYEIEEISAANLLPGEEEELRSERIRLANAEKLLELASAAYEAMYAASGETPAAADLVGQSLAWLTDLERIVPSLAPLRVRSDKLAADLEDIAASLRDYRDTIEYNPHRLEEVEDRLALIGNLRRKYGATIPEVLAYRERAQQELQRLSGGEERLAHLEAKEQSLLNELATLAHDLSQRRQEAAVRLASEVEEQLRDLAMDRAAFRVDFQHREAADGLPIEGRRLAFDRTGIDRVEFMLSPNPGEPLRPLARIASGGENSRLMLALKTVLSHADDTGTLIFDEIDAGIGGRLGRVVGQKLAQLAHTHQVVCVTHLPQLAAFADTHLRVSKEVAGERTRTTVTALSGEQRLEELAAMLGGVTPTNLRSAEELLERVKAL